MSVSVVMPALQVAQTIGKAIASLQAQTISTWELIVLDDGSTDGTQDIVTEAAAQDTRIRLIRLEAHLGPALARARGTQEARYDLISYFDADDLLFPDALQSLEAALARPENAQAVLAYGHYVRIDAKGRPVGIRRFLPRPQRPSGDVLRAFLASNHLANGGCALVRKAAALRSRCWDQEGLQCAEDWVAWTLLAAEGPFVFLPFLTALAYRELPSGLSQTVNTDFDNARFAIDAVFNNPVIQNRLARNELDSLRNLQEAHMWAYIATLHERRKDWQTALACIKTSIALAPQRAIAHIFQYIVTAFDAYVF